MPKKKRKSDERAVCDITTYAWEYSKAAGGDFDGTFNVTPTYLVLVDLFTELLTAAPCSEDVASIAEREGITLDEAKARLVDAETKQCLDYAQSMIIEDLPAMLTDAVRELPVQIATRTLSDLADQISIDVDSPGQLLKAMSARFYARNKRRMKVKQGGARKKKKAPPETGEECEKFARLVDEVKEIWDFVLNFFSDNHYDDGCVEMVKSHSEFKSLVEDHPIDDSLLREVFLREHSSARQYSPHGMALKHAYSELFTGEIPSYGTLRKRYTRGRELIDSATDHN